MASNIANLDPYQIFSAARLRVMEKFPYFAHALHTIRVREHEKEVYYITKDGVMYWSPALVRKEGTELTMASILHELMHFVMDHAERVENAKLIIRNKVRKLRPGHEPTPAFVGKIWNYAADAECNSNIRLTGITLPSTWVFGQGQEYYGVPLGKSAEAYLAAMLKSDDFEKAVRDAQAGAGKSKGQGGDKFPPRQCGSCSGAQTKPDKDDPDKCSAAEMSALRTKIAEEVAKHSWPPGSHPGTLVGWAKKHLGPSKVPWADLLRARAAHHAAVVRGNVDYSFTRFSRRQWGIARAFGAAGRPVPIYPGTIAPQLRLYLAIDTSGSMGDREQRETLTEVHAILSMFDQVHVIACDAKVQDVGVVRSIDDVYQHMKGGGGTSFRPVFEEIEQGQRMRPDVLVYCTDGCGDAPSKAPPYPVIWVMVGRYARVPYDAEGGGHITWGERVCVNDRAER